MADRQARQAAKRMRLGTKSCAECRRRKVRCIFPPGTGICQGCALHNVACTSQLSRGQAQEQDVEANLQQRIVELERIVKSLASSQSAQDTPISHDESLNGQPSAGDLLGGSNPSRSPLINLFRDALLIGEADGHVQDDGGPSGPLPASSGLLSSSGPYIPSTTTIRSILSISRKYWCTWPACYYGADSHQTFQVNRDGEGEEYLVKLLFRPRYDASFCKALLWLALCVQQLPMDQFRTTLPNSPSKQHLLASYLSYCRLILASTEQDSLDDVQCQILCFKLYINMGMPQRAWSCTRSAISTSILLGLDKLDARATESHRMMWLLSWETERQLSLLLGYPSAVQTTRLPFGCLPMGLEASPEYHVLHALAVMYGDVINRDQLHSQGGASYAATIKIDEDVQKLRDVFPADWWEPCGPSNTVADVYYREGTKSLYFLLLKLVHFPYMLMSVRDRRYEHSRHSALEAAREQIRCYVRLRSFPGAEILMCELMDFQAFNAGIAIVIGALYMPGMEGGLLDISSEDGVLIESLIASLRRVALLLDCRVAEQGAQVLELLIDSRRISGDVAVSVPYFGKLRIRRRGHHSVDLTDGSTSSSISGFSPATGQAGFPTPMPPVVEFSTNEFVKGGPMQFKQGDELRQDWFGVVDTDACYDWQHTWSMDMN